MKTPRADAAPDRFLWPAWAAFSAALATVPYFLTRALAPEGSRYLWNLPPYGADSQAYLAWERQAALGNWLFKLKYTAAPHAAFIFQPFFLAVGKISAWGGWELGPVQLVFKAAGVLLFWTAFRRLARRLEFGREALWSAALLAGLGTGLGWLSPSAAPADLWLIDSNTLWSLTWNPLFPFSLALLLFFVESCDREPLLAGVFAALLLLVHPYAAPLLVLFALWTAWRAGPGAAVRLAVPVVPVAVYLTWAVLAHPILALHGREGAMNSPSWISLLIGWAPPLALALGGWSVSGRDFVRRYAPLFVWVAGALLLCRLPFWFQRKILFGVHAPLCLLGGAGAAELSRRWRGVKIRAWGLAAAAVAVSLPTWALISADARRILSTDERADYFVARPLMDALEQLGAYGSPDQVVFSSPETGGLVPAVSGKTALWGHWAQSVDYDETRRWLDGLTRTGTPAEKARLLWSKTDYVLADGEFKRAVDVGELSWIKGESSLLFSEPGADVYGPPAR